MENKYIKPIRRVLTEEDLKKWQESATFGDIVTFVTACQEAVKGLTNDADVQVSSVIKGLLAVLDAIEHLSELNPVVHDKESSRFGKMEFRDFYDSVTDQSVQLLTKNIPDLDVEDKKGAITELTTYLNECWGNRTRIDYGSGHELNFICFLVCLDRLHLIEQSDYAALVLKVFTKYIAVMRKLQREYWLEPAGSHGVWGLDDYHFLPFLFGASQLATHPHLRPKSIHDKDLLEMFHEKYMYFECIWFINSVKTSSLRWHSPMLDDISGVKKWSKVSEGMVKMYKAEVLNKLPIIQHFMFGSLLEAPEGVSAVHEGHDDDDCGHDHSTWADCCGIKVPSAIGAFEVNHKVKPVPFD